MTTDYFALSPAIVQRLKSQVPELGAVAGADLPPPDDSRLKKPAAIVVYDGYTPGGRVGGKTQLYQLWRIALAAPEPNDPSGEAARAVAGPLMVKVINALTGWKPAPGVSPLELAPEKKSGPPQAGVFHVVFQAGMTI